MLQKYFTRVTIYDGRMPRSAIPVASVPVEFSAEGGPKGAKKKMGTLIRQDIRGRLPEEYKDLKFSLNYHHLYKSRTSVPGSDLPELDRIEF